MSEQQESAVQPSPAAPAAAQPQPVVERVDLMTGKRVQDLPPPAAGQKLVGFRGWLILPAFWTLVAPLGFLYSIGGEVDVISRTNFSQLPWFPKAHILSGLAASFILLCGSGFALWSMFRRKRVYPKLFVGLIVAALVISIADILMSSVLYDLPINADDKRDLARTLLMCVIWIPYMLVSRRVKATFTN